jgi:integrase
VELPFTDLIKGLFELAQKNPWGVSPESFVFWTERKAGIPMSGRLLVDGLRDALQKVGFSKEAAAGYLFHGWRHFYTSYMIDKLGKKLLKSQTGHRTDIMLSLYGDHSIAGDREKIQIAAAETFGALISSRAQAV